jgi:hypothetical protein
MMLTENKVRATRQRFGTGFMRDITEVSRELAQLFHMPRGLRRFQQSRRTHFVAFSCYST